MTSSARSRTEPCADSGDGAAGSATPSAAWLLRTRVASGMPVAISDLDSTCGTNR
jgi:hypothetical protein